MSDGTLTVSAPLVQDNVDSIVSGLHKIGSGTLVLSGSDSYSGGTTVNSGTLVLDGAASLLAGSSLTIGVYSSPGAVFAPPAASPTVA